MHDARHEAISASKDPTTQTLDNSPGELARAKDASFGRNRKAKRAQSLSDDGERQNMLEAVTEHEDQHEDDLEMRSLSSEMSRNSVSPTNTSPGEPLRVEQNASRANVEREAPQDPASTLAAIGPHTIATFAAMPKAPQPTPASPLAAIDPHANATDQVSPQISLPPRGENTAKPQFHVELEVSTRARPSLGSLCLHSNTSFEALTPTALSPSKETTPALPSQAQAVAPTPQHTFASSAPPQHYSLEEAHLALSPSDSRVDSTAPQVLRQANTPLPSLSTHETLGNTSTPSGCLSQQIPTIQEPSSAPRQSALQGEAQATFASRRPLGGALAPAFCKPTPSHPEELSENAIEHQAKSAPKVISKLEEGLMAPADASLSGLKQSPSVVLDAASRKFSPVAAQKKLWQIDKIGDFHDSNSRGSFNGGSLAMRSTSSSVRPRSAVSLTSGATSRPHSAKPSTRPKSAPSHYASSNQNLRKHPFGSARVICVKTSPSYASKFKSDIVFDRRLLKIQNVFTDSTSDFLQLQDYDLNSSNRQSSKVSKLPEWILPCDTKPKRRMARAHSAPSQRPC